LRGPGWHGCAAAPRSLAGLRVDGSCARRAKDNGGAAQAKSWRTSRCSRARPRWQNQQTMARQSIVRQHPPAGRETETEGQARGFSAKASLRRWGSYTLRFRPPQGPGLNPASTASMKFGSAALTTADLPETPTRNGNRCEPSSFPRWAELAIPFEMMAACDPGSRIPRGDTDKPNADAPLTGARAVIFPQVENSSEELPAQETTSRS